VAPPADHARYVQGADASQANPAADESQPPRRLLSSPTILDADINPSGLSHQLRPAA